MQIAEWTIWGLAAFWTFQWSWAFRRRVGEGKPCLISAATIPLLWVICLIFVPVLGYSLFHLLWLFPLCCALRILSPLFPLSLLHYPGLLYARLWCIGLQVPQDPMEQEAMELVDDLVTLLDEQYFPGLLGVGHARRGRKTRMRALDKDDVDRLRNLLSMKGTETQDWKCKLHGGNIIIYSSVAARVYKDGTLEPSTHRWAKHLRIVPEPGGPFRLEHMRQKGRWCSIDAAVGDMEAIAGFIKDNMLDFSHADAPQLKLQYHPHT